VAAVLCVDIAGFTSLTETFSHSGAQGAERLAAALNEALQRIIEAVVGSGGDIISFAGDAVWAAWPVSSGDDAASALMFACVAAANSQASAKQPMPHGVELKLRAVVGYGKLLAVAFTGAKPVSLVLGEAIEDAGALLSEARVGEVALSHRAVELCGARCSTSPISRNAHRFGGLTTPPQAPPASGRRAIDASFRTLLERAVPRSVQQRLLAGSSQWTAEFRTVSAIFIGLPGFKPMSATKLPELEATLDSIQACLGRFDGDLYMVLADEKGLIAIGLFGAPPFGHEDDAIRAVRTALAIEAELHARRTESSIGVASGRAFCEVCGTDARRTLTIAGPAMNIAARLMQYANGSILCDAETANSVGPHSGLTFQRPKALSVKGKAEAIPAFRPNVDLSSSAIRLAPESRRRPVGRARELALLTQALDALHEQAESRLIVLEGEAGIGKSRIAGHFLTLAAGLKVRPITASAGIETGVPYRALRSVFTQLLGLAALAPAPALRREAVLAALAPHDELVRWAALLNTTLELNLPEDETIAQLSESARAAKTRELLLGILAIGRGPRVLLIEDAHRLDSASWGFVTDALRSSAGLLVVMTARPPDGAHEAYEELLEQATTTRIQVGRLSVADTAELVCQRLAVSALPEGVAELICARASGNALFSGELACAMRELSLLVQAGDRCNVAADVVDLEQSLNAALEQRGVPPTLQGIITSRLDRMSVEQQLVLKVASVLGGSFPEALLADVCRVHEPAVDARAVLRSVLRQDILLIENEDLDAIWTFRHTLVREAIYGIIPFKERERMHRHAAEWYERVGAGSHRGVLAQHWQRAGERERAVLYFDEAGVDALREYANKEAASFFSTALSLDENQKPISREIVQRWAARRLNLGAAHVAWSKYATSRNHLEHGLRLVGQRVPSTTLAAAFWILIEVLRQILHRVFSQWFVGREHPQRDSLLRKARAFEGLTESYFNLGENALCLYSALRSLNLAELAGASAELARGYASVGAIVGFIPWVTRARDYCRRARQIAESLHDRPAEAWAAVATGVMEAGLAEWAAAEQEFDRTYTLGLALGDGRRCDDSSENKAAVQYLRGDFHGALRTAAQLWESSHRRGDLFMQADSLRRQAYCCLAFNRTSEAAEAVERLAEIRRKEARTKNRELNSDVYLLRALIHLRRGELIASRRELEAGARILAESSFMFYDVVLEHATHAEVSLALRERGELGAAAGRAACRRLSLFARSFPCAKPAALLWAAQEAWLSDKPSKARKLWSSAIQLARSRGLPYFEAIALFHASSRLKRSDPVRIEQLLRCKDLLLGCGERFYANQATEALGLRAEPT